jgi:hypothetical protein
VEAILKRARDAVMVYEIWETTSRNCVAAFPTLGEALALIRQSVEQNGDQYTDTLVLAREDDEGDVTLVSEGAALWRLANSVAV